LNLEHRTKLNEKLVLVGLLAPAHVTVFPKTLVFVAGAGLHANVDVHREFGCPILQMI
jgi:hypothetical protein